jgi:hypothetical protein
MADLDALISELQEMRRVWGAHAEVRLHDREWDVSGPVVAVERGSGHSVFIVTETGAIVRDRIEAPCLLGHVWDAVVSQRIPEPPASLLELRVTEEPPDPEEDAFWTRVQNLLESRPVEDYIREVLADIYGIKVTPLQRITARLDEDQREKEQAERERQEREPVGRCGCPLGSVCKCGYSSASREELDQRK